MRRKEQTKVERKRSRGWRYRVGEGEQGRQRRSELERLSLLERLGSGQRMESLSVHRCSGKDGKAHCSILIESPEEK